MIETLKNLKLVDIGCLLLHESQDKARLMRLAQRVEDEGVQRNPVIVAPHEGSYIVLDGAHRVSALSARGYCFVLVQVVEFPVNIKSWGHLLEDTDLRRVLPLIEGIEVLQEPPEAGLLAEVEFPGGDRLWVRSKAEGLFSVCEALKNLQQAYPEGVVVHRVDPERPIRLSEGEALLRYRRFTLQEMVEIVGAGEVLPAGITRFIIPERVLNVRLPLSYLRQGELEVRSQELKTLVRELWDQNRIRYYDEPILLFE